MKKEAKSPAAKERKRKYETEYESSPARKKYRRELERERRKRGVAGKGGKDMSHTKTGKIVPEDPHTNRARSHPSVGSTLKAPMWDAQGNQMTGEPKPMPNLKQRGFPFAGAFKQGMKAGPKDEQRLFFESPDESSRALVDLPKEGDDANMALFGVHMDQQGKGKGREGLVNLKNELGEMGKKNLHQFERFSNMTPESVEFWDKMRSEGVTKAPLYDTATGKQVAGVPTPIPSKDDLRFENNMNFDFDYSNHAPVQPNERFLYQSPDQKVRAIVESRGKHASIPIFATHGKERGKGHGRQALHDIRSELRTIHPDVEHIEPTGVIEQSHPFWEKMNDEGLVSYEGDYEPDIATGEPMDIAMRLLKEQKKLFVQGQKTLDGRPAFAPTDFVAEEQRRQAALKRQQDREKREAQRRKNAIGLTPLPFQQNPEQQG